MTAIAAAKPSPTYYSNLLQTSLGCVSRHDGTATQFHTECAVSLWASLRRTQKTQRFLTTTEEIMLTSLLDGSHGIKQPAMQQLCSSLTDDALHQLHHNVILENFATIISNMTSSLSAGGQGVVPMQILPNITNLKHTMLWCSPLAVGENLLACCRSLNLLNTISKMVMQTGLQAPVCTTSNCLVDRMCSGKSYKDHSQLSLHLFLGTMRSVERDLAELSCNDDEEILQLAHEHLMILLAHGYRDASFFGFSWWLGSSKSKTLLDGKRILVSMSSQDMFNTYLYGRNQVKRKILSGSQIPLPKHLERILKEYKQKAIFGLNRFRSLKELCRVKLYEIVPKGTIPQYVQHLHLSREQKDYLSLGVHPL